MRIKFWSLVVGMVGCVLSVGGLGCTPASHSQPQQDRTYPVMANSRGIQLLGGTDRRDETARQAFRRETPIEDLVIDALHDELRHAHLFEHIEVSPLVTSPTPSDRHSHIVRFSVLQFHVYSFPTEGTVAPSVAAEMEFEVFDGKTAASVFRQRYKASPRRLQADTSGGKEGQKRQIREALEEIVPRFISDLATLPLSRTGIVVN